MNNMKQQFTEAMHILSKDIKVWNKRIEQLNYPRWVLASTDGRMLRLSVGDFDANTSMCNLDQLIEFQTEQEAFDALDAMRSSQHLNAVSELVSINLLLPRFIPVNQYEINILQSWINKAVEEIKFFQDMLGILNVQGTDSSESTQIIDIPEQQTDVVLEYGVLVTPNEDDKDPFTHVHWHDSFADAEDYINFVHFLMNEFYPNATYSVIARSKGE